MKSNIHANWHSDSAVTCACGASFTAGSVSPALQIDVCSECHPFYTGTLTLAAKKGRVEKFMQKEKAATGRKTTKQAPVTPKTQLTLKEMLSSTQASSGSSKVQ